MASALLSHEVSDLTLGKPPLFWLPSSAPVAHALRALKLRDETHISVWRCSPASHLPPPNPDLDSALEGAIQGPDAWRRLRKGECFCAGKVDLLRIVCYLATEESLRNPADALRAPLSVLLPENSHSVRHVDSDASLLEALDLIADGAQNLIVATDNPYNKFIQHPLNASQKFTQKSASIKHISPPSGHNGREYCWLTQEDVVRFLLGFIGIFSPLPMMSIEDLGVINTDVLMVESHCDAISALHMIRKASDRMSAVAVVEIDGQHGAKLVGEISSSTLHTCDETAALALATLSAGDFITYTQYCQSPPDSLVEIVRSRLAQKIGLGTNKDAVKSASPSSNADMLHIHDLEMWEESSDDESVGPHELPRGGLSRQLSSKGAYGSKGRTSPIVCRPWSSLIAVLVQTLAHRESYVWVTKEDSTLVGIVTFMDILAVFLNHISSTD